MDLKDRLIQLRIRVGMKRTVFAEYFGYRIGRYRTGNWGTGICRSIC